MGATAPPIAAIDEVITRFAPITAELERNYDRLVEQITATIRDESPSHRKIPYAGVRDAVSLHVRQGLEACRGNAAASPADLEEAEVIGREAAHFGLPIEALLQGMRIGVRIFWHACVEAAAARDVDPRTLIAAAGLIWNWADAVALAFERGHREAAVEEAVHLERERSAFLVGVLQGSLTDQELRAGAETYGLSPEAEYVPIRARAFGAVRPAAHCERAIRRALGSAGEELLVCPLEDGLLGVLSRRPPVDDPDVVIGLGRPAPLERIATSYGEATRALEVGARFGLRGALDLADLSLRAPVATETALGKQLVDRYLGPFRDGSHAGRELERTLRAYLAEGLRREPTATTLHVHVNTLRNRLRRIEESTGVDLRDPAHIAELWWALEFDRISQQPG